MIAGDIEQKNTLREDEYEDEVAPAKKRTVPPLLIVLTLIIFCVIGAFFFIFLSKETKDNNNNALPTTGDSNDNNNNNNNNNSNIPTPSPVPIVDEPVTDESNLLSELCTTNNDFNQMKIFLQAASTNVEVYMIEMLKFKNEQLYREYMDYLINDVLPNINGAELVFRMEKIFQVNEEPEWDEVMIIKYPNGPIYLEKVLEQDNGIGNNADREMIKEMLERRNAGLQSSYVWATTLNNEVVNKYSKLVDVSSKKTDLFFHAIKFKSPNGRANVAKFDERTEEVKSANEIYSQAWLDIQASCISGDSYEYDQIRIETLGNYATLLTEEDWTEGSQFRVDGVEPSSISAFASYDISTNLYQNTPSTVSTVEESVADESKLLSKLCSTSNDFNQMQNFLESGSSDSEVYMIEMLKFQNEQLYREYMDYLINDVLPNIDGAELVFRLEKSFQDNEEWDEVMIIKYPNGPIYLENVLEQDNDIGNNADREMIKQMLERRKAGLQNSYVWAATLNTEVVDKYSKLVDVSSEKTDLFFHAIKFKSPNGRANVAKFDELTEDVKNANKIYTQAWLDIQASCVSDDSYEYDQIRIETLGNYAVLLTEEDWTEGSQFRVDGVEPNSISEFASYKVSTNLYQNTPSTVPVASVEESLADESKLLSKLCSTSNDFNQIQNFLESESSDNEVYMIEMLKFQNEQLYREYMDYLVDDILPKIDGAELVFRLARTYQFNDEPDWDEVMIIKYPNGPSYLEKVLEQDNGIGEMLERRNAGLQSSYVWATTLNTDVVDKYSELVNIPLEKTDLFFHAIKFKSPNGRADVARFDERTKEIKSANELYAQAWLDVQASCAFGDSFDYDQIRIETIGGYSAAIVEEDWIEGSEFRVDGIETTSISAFTFNEISTNLYL